MRKRKAFADKELDALTLQRQQAAVQPIFKLPLPIPVKSSSEQGGFLRKLFPTHNPQFLELILHSCSGNLEKAIEHIVAGMSGVQSRASISTTTSTHPAFVSDVDNKSKSVTDESTPKKVPLKFSVESIIAR